MTQSEIYNTPAIEGLLLSDHQYINMEYARKCKTLLIFSTLSKAPFGGVNLKRFLKISNQKRPVHIDFDRLLAALTIRLPYTCNSKSEVMAIRLIHERFVAPNEPLNLLSSTSLRLWSAAVIKACESIVNFGLIVLVADNPMVFTTPLAQELPIIIYEASMLSVITSALTVGYNDFKYEHHKATNKFRVFNSKIDKRLLVDASTVSLYHISPTLGIDKLSARVTSKPLDDENIRIRRISAAPSLRQCVIAVGMGKHRNDGDKLHVYGLNLDKSVTIVKPDISLVPDVEYTDEYWVLGDTKTTYLGYITIRRIEGAKYLEYEFDNLDKSVDTDLPRYRA